MPTVSSGEGHADYLSVEHGVSQFTFGVSGNIFVEQINVINKLKTNRIEPLINEDGTNQPTREKHYENVRTTSDLIYTTTSYDGSQLFNTFSKIENISNSADNIIGLHDNDKSFFLDYDPNPQYLDNVYFSFTNFKKPLRVVDSVSEY